MRDAPTNGRPEPREGHVWLRRDVLSKVGWTAVIGTIVASTAGFVRLLFPRAPIKPVTRFGIGEPGEFAIGSVTGRSHPDGLGRKVWVVRTADGFYAILGECTHLGCNPRWRPAAKKFKCPCHGSGFTRDGRNVEGPAPRALERIYIALDRRGQLIVDPSRRYRLEQGGWEREGAFLAYTKEG